MSWSINSTEIKHDPENIEATREAVFALVASGNEQAPDERDDQVTEAKHVIFDMIMSGGASKTASVFMVWASGHANKGHVHVEGYSNDHMSVNVSVNKYRE